MKLPAIEDQGTGFKFFEPESLEIEKMTSLGVSTQVNLKPTIEKKALRAIRANSPPDIIARFDEPHGPSGLVKSKRARKAAEPTPDNEDWHTFGFILRRNHGTKVVANALLTLENLIWVPTN